MYKYEKTLSFMDVRSDTTVFIVCICLYFIIKYKNWLFIQYLPADFCSLILCRDTVIFEVLDEEYRKWYFAIRQDEFDRTQYSLTRAWQSFKHINNLVEGEVLLFGVVAEHSGRILFQRKNKNGPWCNSDSWNGVGELDRTQDSSSLASCLLDAWLK